MLSRSFAGRPPRYAEGFTLHAEPVSRALRPFVASVPLQSSPLFADITVSATVSVAVGSFQMPEPPWMHSSWCSILQSGGQLLPDTGLPLAPSTTLSVMVAP